MGYGAVERARVRVEIYAAMYIAVTGAGVLKTAARRIGE
jgi:hypothetical protein